MIARMPRRGRLLLPLILATTHLLGGCTVVEPGSASPADTRSTAVAALDRLRSAPCAALQPDQTAAFDFADPGEVQTDEAGPVCVWGDRLHSGSIMAAAPAAVNGPRPGDPPPVEMTVAGRRATTRPLGDSACVATAEVDGGAMTATFTDRGHIRWEAKACPAALRLLQEAVRNLIGGPPLTAPRPSLAALITDPCSVGDELPFRGVDAVGVTGEPQTYPEGQHVCRWSAYSGSVSFLVIPRRRDLTELSIRLGGRATRFQGHPAVEIEGKSSCGVVVNLGRQYSAQVTLLYAAGLVARPRCESARRAMEAAVGP